MFRELLSTALVVTALILSAGPVTRQEGTTNQSPATQAPAEQPPANQSPANQSPVQPQDPAAVLFTTETGLVLHAVKPGSTADYEAAMLSLKQALSAAAEPETQKIAAGWRIYRAAESDAKSSVIYVHWLDPVVMGVDYRPSLWLDKLLAGAPADLLTKYRDAFAVAPTKLSLTELVKPKSEP